MVVPKFAPKMFSWIQNNQCFLPQLLLVVLSSFSAFLLKYIHPGLFCGYQDDITTKNWEEMPGNNLPTQLLHKDSVQFSCSVMSDSLWPHGLQHPRLFCPSPTPRACSNSCPSSPWCHPTISSSVVPFSSRLQTFPASGTFPMSQFFTSGGQSIGDSASASVLPMNI